MQLKDIKDKLLIIGGIKTFPFRKHFFDGKSLSLHSKCYGRRIYGGLVLTQIGGIPSAAMACEFDDLAA